MVANARFFDNDSSKVPSMAVTVGIGTVMDVRPPAPSPLQQRAQSLTRMGPSPQAREVIILATGPHKALALHKAVEEGVSHMWTVSALQLHPRAAIGT